MSYVKPGEYLEVNRKEIVDLYQKCNYSAKEIATQQNLPYYLVRKKLVSWGIPIREAAPLNLKKWRERNPDFQNGPKNPAWKDGYSKSSINRLVKRLLGEAGVNLYVCMQCAKKSHTPRNVHHIDGNRRNNVLSNLRVLCPRCHNHTHGDFHESRRNLKTGRYE